MPSNNNSPIYFVTITQADGTKKIVLRSAEAGHDAIKIDLKSAEALFVFLALIDKNKHCPPPMPLIIAILSHFYQASCLDDRDRDNKMGHLYYALNGLLMNPSLFAYNNFLFSDLCDAAFNGDEAMVLRILNGIEQNGPDALQAALTTIGSATGNGNASFTGTVLQAAIAATDIQLCEKIKPYFERIPNGFKQMQKQIKAIYKKSLRGYFKDQECAALRSDNINLILKTHEKAQIDNAFDFKPYVDAICNATQKELDVVMELINATTPEATAAAIANTGVSFTQTPEARAKSFDQLTLVEKLNRFREEFVKHTQSEIIFNPHHILVALQHNEKTWDEVDAHLIADPEYKNRIVIFSQLVGWSQRNAAEPVKQDIRQGTYYLTEEKEPRARPARFNDWNSSTGIVRNSLVDRSLINSSAVDGIGYKFAAALCPRHAGVVWLVGLAVVYRTYVEQKHQRWKTYCAMEITSTARLLGDVR